MSAPAHWTCHVARTSRTQDRKHRSTHQQLQPSLEKYTHTVCLTSRSSVAPRTQILRRKSPIAWGLNWAKSSRRNSAMGRRGKITKTKSKKEHMVMVTRRHSLLETWRHIDIISIVVVVIIIIIIIIISSSSSSSIVETQLKRRTRQELRVHSALWLCRV